MTVGELGTSPSVPTAHRPPDQCEHDIDTPIANQPGYEDRRCEEGDEPSNQADTFTFSMRSARKLTP